MVIFTKDTYRASVEAASGGQQTVLYDDKGFPSIMNVVPKFRLEDIDPELGSGVHPAFIKGGVEKSELFVATYSAIVAEGRAVSIPGVIAATASHDAARQYCAAKGPGWHLMTNWEWAAIALWCAKNGFVPRGNTQYGAAYDALYETGVRGDGVAPGITSGNPRTKQGSGPSTWNHNLQANGIADLVGNYFKHVDLLKIVDGRIYMPMDNNYDMPESEWPALDAYFDASAAGSDDGNVQNVGAAMLAGSVTNNTLEDYVTEYWANLSNKSGFSTPLVLKQALVAPIQPSNGSPLSKLSKGLLYVRNKGERLALRGGDCWDASNAGLGFLYLLNVRTYSYEFRPAFMP